MGEVSPEDLKPLGFGQINGCREVALIGCRLNKNVRSRGRQARRGEQPPAEPSRLGTCVWVWGSGF